MNIFYLSDDPQKAAQFMVDKHVIKIILESVQILCTTHHVLDGKNDYMYKPTHVNHPSVKWARQTIDNYEWLKEHTKYLFEEYGFRWNKEHKSISMFNKVIVLPKNLSMRGETPVPCAMDNQYIISDDPIVNYRNYYKNGKVHLHKWTKREVPYWI